MPDKSGPDLISASDLFSALVRVKVTSPGEVICINANAGRIRSYAENLTANDEDVPPNEEFGGNHVSTVPREFWWANGGAALDQNWSANIFSTRLTRRGNTYSRGNDPYSSSGKDQVRMQALGVCFNLADALECFPSIIMDHTAPRPVEPDAPADAHRGRKRDVEKWDIWIAGLLAYAHTSGVDEGLKSANKVAGEVEDVLRGWGYEDDQFVSQSSTRPSLGRILEAFRKNVSR